MIVLIDNYDSFVQNLARYLRRLGQNTKVIRHDAVTPAELLQLQPEALVISPGPCTPREAGVSLSAVKSLAGVVPILGICLGHQVIAEALGGKVIRASEPVHGRASQIHHDGQAVFAGVPSPLWVGRYHSLVVEPVSLPACLAVDATLADGTIMAFRHQTLPIVGWQFHPESVLTQNGFQLLANFLRYAGLAVTDSPQLDQEVRHARVATPDWFQRSIEYPSAARRSSGDP